VTFLRLFKVLAEAGKAVYPQGTVVFEPPIDIDQGLEADTTRTTLGITASGYETGIFQNADMFRNPPRSHAEGLRQFRHRSVSLG
jgi:hypothetical protein